MVHEVHEHRIKRSWLIAIFALGVVIIVANDLLRKFAEMHDSLAATFMGSFPNFVAALALPALIMFDLQKRHFVTRFSNSKIGLLSGAISFALLTFYELSQAVTPNATLDPNDIFATAAGAAVWLAFCPSLNRLLRAG